MNKVRAEALKRTCHSSSRMRMRSDGDAVQDHNAPPDAEVRIHFSGRAISSGQLRKGGLLMKKLKGLVTLRMFKVVLFKRGEVRKTKFQIRAGSPLLAQHAVRRDHPGCRIVSLQEVFLKGPKQTERVSNPRASGIWGNPYAMRVSRVISGGLPSLGKRR